MMAHTMVARALNVPESELAFRYTGMNHFGWVTGVRRGGEDMMPRLLDRADKLGLPYDPDIARALGVIPTSYFKYFYHQDRMLAAQQGKRPRAEELIEMETEILAAYQSGNLTAKPDALVRRSAAWYQHMIVPTLLAHANNTGEVKYVQIRNLTAHGDALRFMPPESIVEVPCLIKDDKIMPLPYDNALPPDLEELLRLNATCEMLWAEAVAEHDRPKALRAMLINHLVTTYDQAQGLLAAIWPP
jgi:6-phospho-beta-glucosidase